MGSERNTHVKKEARIFCSNHNANCWQTCNHGRDMSMISGCNKYGAAAKRLNKLFEVPIELESLAPQIAEIFLKIKSVWNAEAIVDNGVTLLLIMLDQSMKCLSIAMFSLCCLLC